jgi:hypothetical protein
LTGLKVAVPPPPPLSFIATDNGNRTVTLAWQPPNHPPPDLIGYRLSRRDAASPDYLPPGDLRADTLSFVDSSLPAGGGSYFYKVETLRSSPSGTLRSTPAVTSEPLVVGALAGTSGRSVGGTPAPNAGSGGTGAMHFDVPSTLAADEGEPGSGYLTLPGAGTIQRFAGRDGAGLIKPFAAALDLAVWAGLLLFLTRRAASAARVDAL